MIRLEYVYTIRNHNHVFEFERQFYLKNVMFSVHFGTFYLHIYST